MESLIPNNNQELLTNLQTVSKELIDEVTEIPAEEAALMPVAGEWSVLEIMCNLRDTEQIWNERLNQMIEDDEPFFEGLKPDELADHNDYKHANWEQARLSFETARNTNIEILQKLSPIDWLNGAIHQDRGHLTISQVAELLLTTTQSGLEQIRHVRWLAK